MYPRAMMYIVENGFNIKQIIKQKYPDFIRYTNNESEDVIFETKTFDKVTYYQIITPGSTVKILPISKEIKSEIIFKNTELKNKNIYKLMEEYVTNGTIHEIHQMKQIFAIFDA
jgi:hypothetical protein